MKKIEKLSLNRLSKKELTLGEMSKVKGGTSCQCSCCYGGLEGDPGYGGSSTGGNGNANCGNSWYYAVDPNCPHEAIAWC